MDREEYNRRTLEYAARTEGAFRITRAIGYLQDDNQRQRMHNAVWRMYLDGDLWANEARNAGLRDNILQAQERDAIWMTLDELGGLLAAW